MKREFSFNAADVFLRALDPEGVFTFQPFTRAPKPAVAACSMARSLNISWNSCASTKMVKACS